MTSENILNVLLNYLPNHYKKESGSNNYQFLLSFAENFNSMLNQIIQLKNDIQISTATGNDLDDIGELFKLDRRPQESDDNYRSRILSYWSSLLGGGTKESISTSLSRLLDISQDSITITSNYANMIIEIGVDEDTDTSLLNNIESTVTDIKAAGVGIQKINFVSENEIFRINLSEINGEDTII
jgi:hypothetical protein